MEFILFNTYFLLLALVYRFLFDKVGDIKWNRWLLLLTPLFLILLLVINKNTPVESSLFVLVFDAINIINSAEIEESTTAGFSITQLLILIYLTGVFVSVIFHTIRFIKLFQLLKKSNFLYTYKNAKVYAAEFNASFGNHIFLQAHLSEEEKSFLLAHEYAHVHQKHSLDRIFAVILQSICWFNPGVYFWKTDIEKNHEYLADQEVLSNMDKESYTVFLLEQRLNLKANQLQLPLSNMSNLKSRVMKMNQKTSSVLSYLLLPILAVGMMSSKVLPAMEEEPLVATTEDVNQKEQEPEEEPDEMAEFNGGMEAMQNYLANAIKYPENAVENKIQGTVFVQAVVTEKGKVSQVEILRGVSPEIDAEAIRVFEEMPDWIPAKKDAEAVASTIILPLKFLLKDKEEE